MTRRITTAGAAIGVVLVLALTGCGVTGTVVDKGYRTDPSRINGKTTYNPCWWVKVRDDSGSKHTTCTSHRRWKKTSKGDHWTG